MIPPEELARGLAKAGVADAQKHLFFCLGPECCAATEGEKLWEFAKREIHSLKLSVMRTKTGCFRVCAGGPIMVVYPDGIWYGASRPSASPASCANTSATVNPCAKWIIASNQLSPAV